MNKKKNMRAKNMKKMPDNQIVFYQSSDGSVNIEVLYAEENIWLTQKKMADLFDCSTDNISLHLKNIFGEKELDKDSVTEEYSATVADGKSYLTKFYSQYSKSNKMKTVR